MGQVTKPGTLTFTPSMTVVEAITAAGGFTPMAAKNDTTVTRTEAGQKTTLKVPVEDIGTGKARNVYLQPGDIISVPERLF
jgi:polysaccharide export outer membrane protein